MDVTIFSIKAYDREFLDRANAAAGSATGCITWKHA